MVRALLRGPDAPCIRLCKWRADVTDNDRAEHIAAALDQARRAYLALTEGERLPTVSDLARSQHYRQLLSAGARIRLLGSREMFLQAAKRLFGENDALSAQAERDLVELWAGIAEWPDHMPPMRVN